MLLKKLAIENFRGITELELDVDTTTVLIGENNTAKTSVLEALNLCMTRSGARRFTPFSDYDFHLASVSAESTSAPPIIVTLTFEEDEKGEWAAEIVQTLGDVIVILPDDKQRITLRVKAVYDPAIRDFDAEWIFLDAVGNPLPAKQQRIISDLQQLVPVFLLTAIREASQHFSARAPFWGSFTRNPEIDDKKRKEIEDQVGAINQSVLDSHKPFEAIRKELSRTGELVPLSSTDLITVETLPARIIDMLARTQIKVAASTGARLPITQHGSGTQSLSVLFLFDAFLKSRLAEAYDKNSQPILALEEPESHLHPSAIRALWPVLEALGGQKLIATHSGDLASVVPLTSIRRLARRNGKIHVFQIRDTTLDASETRRVAYHIRAKRGALLFSRCWLLVEGESEFTLIPELARALGKDLDQSVVACVEYSQCPVIPLIKAANALGIEWHVLADGDKTGTQKANAATKLIGSSPLAERVTVLSEPDIEHCLWHGGYSYVYENAVDAKHKHLITSPKGSPGYADETINAACKTLNKPMLAYIVAMEALKSGSPGVPAELQTVIETVITLADRSK